VRVPDAALLALGYAGIRYSPAPSTESELRMDSPERHGPRVQLSFLCPCGQRIALKALGCYRSCYDRRRHSLRLFGGLRERVLERDRFRCRGCGIRWPLVVHHRDRRNWADLLVTLCIATIYASITRRDGDTGFQKCS
jgi:hypothetical protein